MIMVCGTDGFVKGAFVPCDCVCLCLSLCDCLCDFSFVGCLSDCLVVVLAYVASSRGYLVSSYSCLVLLVFLLLFVSCFPLILGLS